MCTRNELNLILQAMTQAYQAVYGANVVKIILMLEAIIKRIQI
mgnify:CR=1 FL=1